MASSLKIKLPLNCGEMYCEKCLFLGKELCRLSQKEMVFGIHGPIRNDFCLRKNTDKMFQLHCNSNGCGNCMLKKEYRGIISCGYFDKEIINFFISGKPRRLLECIEKSITT